MEPLKHTLQASMMAVCQQHLGFATTMRSEALLGITMDTKTTLSYQLHGKYGTETSEYAMWSRRSSDEESEAIRSALESSFIKVCEQWLLGVTQVQLEGTLSVILDNREIVIISFNKVASISHAEPVVTQPQPTTVTESSPVEPTATLPAKPVKKKIVYVMLGSSSNAKLMRCQLTNQQPNLLQAIQNQSWRLADPVEITGVQAQTGAPEDSFDQEDMDTGAESAAQIVAQENAAGSDTHPAEISIEIKQEVGVQEVGTYPTNLVCPHCDGLFSSREELQQHARMHLAEFRFRCDQCDEKFGDKEALKEHQKAHPVKSLAHSALSVLLKLGHGDWVREHQCPICRHKLGSLFNLKRHLLGHKEAKLLSQGDINEFFRISDHKVRAVPTLAELTFSSLTHPSEDKPGVEFQCELCGKTLPRFEMQCHLSQHHERVQYQLRKHGKVKKRPRNYECNICDAKFSTPLRREVHEMLHGRSELDFTCPECGRDFNSFSNLERHVALHKFHKSQPSASKKMRCIKCSYCAMSYGSREKLEDHIFLKHQERLGECGLSLEEMKRRNLPKRRGRPRKNPITEWNNTPPKTATDNKDHKYFCLYCNKGYTSKVRLTRHEEMHRKAAEEGHRVGTVRPFYCTKCSRSFGTEKTMRDHELKHMKEEERDQKSAQRQITCPHCHVIYSNTYNLNRHIIKHHK